MLLVACMAVGRMTIAAMTVILALSSIALVRKLGKTTRATYEGTRLDLPLVHANATVCDVENHPCFTTPAEYLVCIGDFISIGKDNDERTV